MHIFFWVGRYYYNNLRAKMIGGPTVSNRALVRDVWAAKSSYRHSKDCRHTKRERATMSAAATGGICFVNGAACPRTGGCLLFILSD